MRQRGRRFETFDRDIICTSNFLSLAVAKPRLHCRPSRGQRHFKLDRASPRAHVRASLQVAYPDPRRGDVPSGTAVQNAIGHAGFSNAVIERKS